MGTPSTPAEVRQQAVRRTGVLAGALMCVSVLSGVGAEASAVPAGVSGHVVAADSGDGGGHGGHGGSGRGREDELRHGLDDDVPRHKVVRSTRPRPKPTLTRSARPATGAGPSLVPAPPPRTVARTGRHVESRIAAAGGAGGLLLLLVLLVAGARRLARMRSV